MTRYDQKVLFTALAFVTVLLQDGSNLSNSSANKINIFARLIGEFCAENIARSSDDVATAHVEDNNAPRIDAAIEMHIQELRDRHETVLPDDRETLIQFYDRLQQRKARRMQWQFYAKATKEKLADLVLHYFDEEIEDANAGKGA